MEGVMKYPSDVEVAEPVSAGVQAYFVTSEYICLTFSNLSLISLRSHRGRNIWSWRIREATLLHLILQRADHDTVFCPVASFDMVLGELDHFVAELFVNTFMDVNAFS